MSHPARPAHAWTYADYARFPDDGNRYEVMDGEVLVTPAPTTRHQYVVGRLYLALNKYVEEHDLGWVFFDVDLLFVTGQFLRPDLLYVPKSGRAGITNRGIETAPGLVIEVMSPASRRIDRIKKPARYADFGVTDYWVVDLDEEVIWTHDFTGMGEPVRHIEVVRWQPDPAASALELQLTEVFRRI